MEIKEAIKHLDELLYNGDIIFGSVFVKALRMAISALEKQDAKKPIDRRCPNCKSDNTEVWQDGGYETTKFRFCPDCGQRIDWSE